MMKPQDKHFWWFPKNGVFKKAKELLAGQIEQMTSEQAEALTGFEKYLQDRDGHAIWRDNRDLLYKDDQSLSETERAALAAILESRFPATVNGIRHAILGAIAYHRGDTNAANDHLRKAFDHYQAAWGLVAFDLSQSEVARKGWNFANKTDDLKAMDAARLDLNVGTLPAWLAVHRILQYVWKVQPPTADAYGHPYGSPASPIKANVLFAAPNHGYATTFSASNHPLLPACWCVDPVALGRCVLIPDFVRSLWMAWFTAKQAINSQYFDPISVRLTPDFETPTQIVGDSAGFACFMAVSAAVRRLPLNTGFAASVALKVKGEIKDQDLFKIQLSDIELGPVGGEKQKVEAAFGKGMQRVYFAGASYQRAANFHRDKFQEYQGRASDNATAKLNLERLRRLEIVELTSLEKGFEAFFSDALFEQVLLEYSNHVATAWDDAWTGANVMGRSMGLVNYQPMRYALLKRDQVGAVTPTRDPESPIGRDSDYELVAGDTEEETLLALLQQSGRLLCISEGPGAGKSVTTQRLLGFVCGPYGREKLFGGRGCLAMRWENGVYGRDWPEDVTQDVLHQIKDRCKAYGCEAKDVFEYAVRHNRFIAIFDSMDQASDRAKQGVLKYLETHLSDSSHRIIVTGRQAAISSCRNSLPSEAWRFGKVLPWTPLRQFAYLRGPLPAIPPEAPTALSSADGTIAGKGASALVEAGRTLVEAWRQREFIHSDAQKAALPVLGLEKTDAPTTDEEARVTLAKALGLDDPSDSRFEDLLGNPQAMYLIRLKATNDTASGLKLRFSNMSELYWTVTHDLLKTAIDKLKPRGQSSTLEEWNIAEALLAALALEMCILDPTAHVRKGDSKVSALRDKVARRLPEINEWRRWIESPGKSIWDWLREISNLTGNTLLHGSSDETLAWPNQRMMEFYAALHLACNAEPLWCRHSSERKTIECGDEAVRRQAAHPQWSNVWRFAIEMPAESHDGPRKDEVLLASISTLFAPVTPPLNTKEAWLRPTESMWRAWCLLEELPRFERADGSATRLPGGERLLASFRQQFEDQLRSQGQTGKTARQLSKQFVWVPAYKGPLKLMNDQRVELDAVELGTTAVTRAQYALFDPAYLAVNRAKLSSYADQTGDCPAGFLSWYDAWVASRYFQCRLATEAEWEWACSAGSRADYCRIWQWWPPFYRDLATEEDLELVADFARSWSRGPRRVRGRLKPNLFGLLGMHGGVWEWCGTWHGVYDSSTKNPHGPERGVHRVFRGGSWDDDADACQTTNRGWLVPWERFDNQGMRLARPRS